MGGFMKIIAITTKDKVFISDNVENKSYHSSQLSYLFFDGEKPQSTFRSDWYWIPKMPIKIERKKADTYENIRWELKEGYPESELTPKVIYDSPDDDDSSFYEVRGLYSEKFDVVPGNLEPIEVEISVISEQDNFEIVKEAFPVSHTILDQLTFNPVLLSTRPSKLSSDEFYKIVREYIKRNINPKYAEITSDYDFCFTVKKIVKLHEPKAYKVDIGTKRRPNYQTRYNQSKSIEIFQMAPKAYQGYTVIESMIGENYKDLEKKVNDYLKELIDKINEPVVECPNCKGHGVVFEK